MTGQHFSRGRLYALPHRRVAPASCARPAGHLQPVLALPGGCEWPLLPVCCSVLNQQERADRSCAVQPGMQKQLHLLTACLELCLSQMQASARAGLPCCEEPLQQVFQVISLAAA